MTVGRYLKEKDNVTAAGVTSVTPDGEA
jgi:hypothetical protein